MKNIPLFNVLNAILKIIMKTAAYKIFVKHLMVVHSAAPSLASSRNVPIYSQLVVQILIPHDYKSLQPVEAKFKCGISGSTKSVNTQDSRIFHESVHPGRVTLLGLRWPEAPAARPIIVGADSGSGSQGSPGKILSNSGEDFFNTYYIIPGCHNYN